VKAKSRKRAVTFNFFEPLSTVGLGDAISAAGLAADLAAGAGAA
jgi:hypothetical protein